MNNETQKSITDFTTKEIVDELLKRKGVNSFVVNPYEDITVSSNGPSIILEIID